MRVIDVYGAETLSHDYQGHKTTHDDTYNLYKHLPHLDHGFRESVDEIKPSVIKAKFSKICKSISPSYQMPPFYHFKGGGEVNKG